ncbi:hypothetical protein BH23PAT1_BH23PAT1_5100 [soil metagenome]
MKLKNLLLAAFSALFTFSMFTSPASAIIGGEVVPKSYSWSVAFVQRPHHGGSVEERVVCSGVLIDKQWILTAYHCWNGIKDTNAVIGRKDLSVVSGEKQYVTASNFYRGNGAALAEHDLMMVKLPKPSSQTPIRLGDSYSANYWSKGTEVRAYGYGCTSIDHVGKKGSRLLKRARFNILTLSPSGQLAHYYNLTAPYGMAIRGLNGGTCNGDSGGPYITSTPRGPRVVGINSASNKLYREDNETTSLGPKVGYRSSSSNSPLYVQIHNTMARFP